MNSFTWEGRWKQLQGQIKKEWNKLTTDEIKATKGRKKFLIGKIQEKYDLPADLAEKKLSDIYRNLDFSDSET